MVTRLTSLENSVESLRRAVENISSDMKDAQRTLALNSLQLSKQSGAVEAVQHDVDSRRSLLAKMESWSKQGESWRDEVDAQMAAMGQRLKATEKKFTEYAEGSSEAATKVSDNRQTERHTRKENEESSNSNPRSSVVIYILNTAGPGLI